VQERITFWAGCPQASTYLAMLRKPDWQSAWPAISTVRSGSVWLWRARLRAVCGRGIEAMTGVDVAGDLRGRYSNRARPWRPAERCGARTMKARLPCWLRATDASNCAAYAQRGDAVLFGRGRGSSLGIVAMHGTEAWRLAPWHAAHASQPGDAGLANLTLSLFTLSLVWSPWLRHHRDSDRRRCNCIGICAAWARCRCQRPDVFDLIATGSSMVLAGAAEGIQDLQNRVASPSASRRPSDPGHISMAHKKWAVLRSFEESNSRREPRTIKNCIAFMRWLPSVRGRRGIFSFALTASKFCCAGVQRAGLGKLLANAGYGCDYSIVADSDGFVTCIWTAGHRRPRWHEYTDH